MTVVLAVPATSDRAGVDTLARHVAEIYGCGVAYFRPPWCDQVVGTSASASEILERAGGASVEALVLGADQELSPRFWEVVTDIAKPVVVLPCAGAADRRLRRVLLPLDGSEEASRAVAPVAEIMLSAGLSLGAVHVLTRPTVPEFNDQTAHDPRAWSQEFHRRHLPAGVQLDLRRGVPADEVLSEAARSGADMLLLAWSQTLDPERAVVVRTALRGDLPVMLVGERPDAT